MLCKDKRANLYYAATAIAIHLRKIYLRSMNTPKPDHFLDITGDICPMTFVRTRLQIERMSPGEILEIRLRGAEPLQNVPESLVELGHDILSVVPERDAPAESPDAVHLLSVRKT